jgi:hypothetical protein
MHEAEHSDISSLETSECIIKAQIAKAFDSCNCLSIYSYTDFVSLLRELVFIPKTMNKHEKSAVDDMWSELSHNSVEKYVSSNIVRAKILSAVSSKEKKQNSKYAIFFINRQTGVSSKQRGESAHQRNNNKLAHHKLCNIRKGSNVKSQRDIENRPLPLVAMRTYRTLENNKVNSKPLLLESIANSMKEGRKMKHSSAGGLQEQTKRAPLLRINLYGSEIRENN